MLRRCSAVIHRETYSHQLCDTAAAADNIYIVHSDCRLYKLRIELCVQHTFNSHAYHRLFVQLSWT